MANYLFQRAWSLVIVPKDGGVALQYSSAPSVGHPLRLTFNVQTSLAQDSNKASITLYNLSAKTVAWIDRGFTVYLDCGYGKTIPSADNRIFSGQVVERQTSMQGGDTATELVCGDSEFPIQQAHVSVQFRGPTTVAQVLNSILLQLNNLKLAGEGVGITGSVIQKLGSSTFNRYVDTGPASVVLHNLFYGRGIDWYIHAGTLFVQDKHAIASQRATLLTSDTGLLEKPVSGKKGVKFRALIQANIRPGFAVSINSAAYDCIGNYRVCESTFQGDTHGGDWYVDCYAEALGRSLDEYSKPTNQKGDAEAASVDANEDDPDMNEDEIDQ